MADSDPGAGLFYVFNLPPDAALEAVSADDGIPFRPRRWRLFRRALQVWGWLWLLPLVTVWLQAWRWTVAGVCLAGLPVAWRVWRDAGRTLFLNRFGLLLNKPLTAACLWVHVREIAMRKITSRFGGEAYALTVLGSDLRIFDVPLDGLENPMEVVLYALHFSTHAPSRLQFYGFSEQEATGTREFIETVLPDFQVRRFRYEKIPRVV